MMSQAIQISERWLGSRGVVRLSGRILSGAAAGRLLSRVRAACRRGLKELTIDLAGLSAIDCGGIGALLVCLQDAERNGVTLRVTRSPDSIRSMLARSSLLEVFERGGAPGKPVGRGAGRDIPLLVAG
jgi:anti-anti-sigma regulatory factor